MTSREDQVFTSLQIRDTNDHVSITSDNTRNTTKSILIDNSHNQIITCQLQGDRISTFATFVNIGASFNIAATSRDYQTVDDYFPYFRLKMSFSVAPISGSVNAYIVKAI